MPLKEFECQSCRHRFELVLWLKEPNPEACPKCGHKELKQLLGTFRIAGARSKSASADDEFGDEGGGAGPGDDLGGGGEGWDGAGGDDLGGDDGDLGEGAADGGDDDFKED